jgi:hypothetical protein
MLLEKEDEQTVLISLYVMVSNLIKGIQSAVPNHKLIEGSTRGRKDQLALEELIALGVFRHAMNIKDVRHYHRFLLSHYARWFHLPNYPNFLHQMHQVSPYVLLVLLYLCAENRSSALQPYAMDTTALKVCENGRISEHRVCKEIAARGKTTQGWFYGLKLGWVVDAQGHLLSISIRPGNTDDRKFLATLFRNLNGLAVADAGFLSKRWMHILGNQDLFLLTDVKKNMKRLMTEFQHTLLKMRQQVEIRFSQLKYRLQQVVSLARSPLGYISRWLYALCAYALFQRVEATA